MRFYLLVSHVNPYNKAFSWATLSECMLEMLSAARNRKLNRQCLKRKDIYVTRIPVPVLILQLHDVKKDPGAFALCMALLPHRTEPSVDRERSGVNKTKQNNKPFSLNFYDNFYQRGKSSQKAPGRNLLVFHWS